MEWFNILRARLRALFRRETVLQDIEEELRIHVEVERPDQLVRPYRESKKEGEFWGGIAYANYLDLRDQNETLSGLFAFQNISAGISGGEGRDSGAGAPAEIASGELVSGNYFDVLGVKPVLGRGFSPEENRTENSHPVVVLGQAFWQRPFNSDATI